jgi:hypothetical protein
MKWTIDLFMWAYQPHFRLGMERRARAVLKLAGADVDVQALLVGIRHNSEPTAHLVCVEPEDGEWDPRSFFGCASRADDIFATHEGQDRFYGDEASMRDKPENLRRDSVRRSVQEVVDKWDANTDAIGFCGAATRLGHYHVVPILQFKRSQLRSIPRFSARIKWQDFVIPLGLFDAIVDELLREASAALQLPEPGRAVRPLESDATSILRQAGCRLCDAITLITRDAMLGDTYNSLNAISALRYEGTESLGQIVFGPKDSPTINRRFQLTRPLELEKPKLARKAIEMTGGDLCCICSGEEGISALGTLVTPADFDAIQVTFAGHYRWDLIHQEQTLMRVAYGVPKLPTSRLEEAAFAEYLHRRFPTMPHDVVQQVWEVVNVAIEQKHGTMLTISAAAADEAERLSSQCMPVRPAPLTAALVQNLTRIDGAVLLDTSGSCHAIGVILDGMATVAGDPARGARYNSAIRYVKSAPAPTICIVVSEDGDVDLIPRFRPGIRRSEIRRQIELLASATADNYGKSYSWLEAHRFYLTAEECETINAMRSTILSVPQELGEIRLVHSDLTPDPEMDATYYNPEGTSA